MTGKMDRIVLYHGTCERLKDKILSEGLLPWNKVGRYWDMEEDTHGIFLPQMGCIYLAHFDRARNYASYCKDKREKGIVIEVEVMTSNLVPDEDSREDTWEASLKRTDTCAHHGDISPLCIKRVYDCEGKIIYRRKIA